MQRVKVADCREEKRKEGMRSIQYEKSEEGTSGGAAVRKRGNKDASKVRGKMLRKEDRQAQRGRPDDEAKWRT